MTVNQYDFLCLTMIILVVVLYIFIFYVILSNYLD